MTMKVGVVMAILHNQKVAMKILCILAVILFFNLTVGAIGGYYAKEISFITGDMYNDKLLPIQLMEEVRLYSKDTEMKLVTLILTSDRVKQQVLIKEIEANTKNIDVLQKKYQETAVDSFEQSKFEQIKTELPAYRQARTEIIKLATAGMSKEAFELFEKSKPVFSAVQTARGEITIYNMKLGQALHEQGDELALHALKVVIGVTIFTILLSAILGLMLSKAISFPLSRMVIALQAVANGDVTEKPRTFVSRDELGQLADVIVKMRRELGHLIGKITQSSEQVAASSEELTATAEQSAEATKQVASAIAEFADGSASQGRATECVIGLINKMSHNIEQVTTSINSVASVAENTTNAAVIGADRVVRLLAKSII